MEKREILLTFSQLIRVQLPANFREEDLEEFVSSMTSIPTPYLNEELRKRYPLIRRDDIEIESMEFPDLECVDQFTEDTYDDDEEPCRDADEAERGWIRFMHEQNPIHDMT